MMKRYVTIPALIVGYLWTALAMATGVPETKPPTQQQGQTQGQAQQQAQGQHQGQAQGQQQSTSVNTSAVARSDAYAQAGSTSSSSNDGNSQAVEISNPRNAPAIGQGSFAIAGCAVAGNAGGSNINGAGFLGFGFTPEQCYDFMLAQAYQSAGAYQAACEVLNASRAGRRAAKRGVTLPTCSPPAAPAAATATVQPVVIEGLATRAELLEAIEVQDEKIRRAFERKASK